MKSIIGTLFLVILFISCSKDENTKTISSAQVFRNENGTEINFSNKDWFLTRVNSGGNVNLKLIGTTNADSLLLRKRGFGLLTFEKLNINNQHLFNTDETISATSSVSYEIFTASTIITAYKGTDVFKVELQSGNLQY